MSKTNVSATKYRIVDPMDPPPKTRRETKKDPKTKGRGMTIYSAKHVRQAEARTAKKSTS
jgi:hypothetical protein